MRRERSNPAFLSLPQFVFNPERRSTGASLPAHLLHEGVLEFFIKTTTSTRTVFVAKFLFARKSCATKHPAHSFPSRVFYSAVKSVDTRDAQTPKPAPHAEETTPSVSPPTEAFPDASNIPRFLYESSRYSKARATPDAPPINASDTTILETHPKRAYNLLFQNILPTWLPRFCFAPILSKRLFPGFSSQ